MASIIEVYKAVQFSIHQTQNGELNYSDFNERSKLAEIRMLGWLTGKVTGDTGQQIVTPYDNQKNRDWLTPIIVKYSANVVDGKITRPADYYQYENMYALSLDSNCCDDECEEPAKVKGNVVTLLQGQQFEIRKNTDIKLLKPSVKVPIAKQVAKTFEFCPEDLGSVRLEYISYPAKYGNIITKVDTVYKEEVPDLSLVEDYVWDDWAIEVLAWFIIDSFATRVRSADLKQMNAATGIQP